ncbi:hypothetical protein H257_18558 [Aphanomyces astaci]|uniref:Chromo domain-containing protein n=1 Tax=Aphanomyces astaci TaxID=112090 RepID=W4FAR5_APHAT|nr:hypothetical protein H257_18558 [Aphanomyces astaci]ETV64570.1 hypothetical protein H257_18558 [Aphanomyces astaci]|eukprot:XP_009845951.1 hypothetical protein H257_18558 [Aphanomyces astaci]
MRAAEQLYKMAITAANAVDQEQTVALKQLRGIVVDAAAKGVWRTKFRGTDLPADVNPLTGMFVEAFGKQMEQDQVIYANNSSSHCSPVNPVMKPEGKKLVKTSDKWTIEELLQYFRLTIDYRIINSQTIPLAGAMPFQFLVLENVRCAKYLGVFDVTKGHCDSALFFQNTMAECFKDLLYKNVLIWIDDILVWANNIDECVLVIIDGDGVRQDPTRIQALCDIPYPTDAGQLQQFICAVNWMRESLIGFAQTMDPLQKRLTEALVGKKSKKRIATSITIDLTKEERNSFDAVKELMRNAAQLCHPHEDAAMCLFTDASAYRWCIVPKSTITAMTSRSTTNNINSSSVKAACLTKRKSTGQSSKKKATLLRNLIRVFAPQDELKAHTREKLIGQYRYVIQHIDGVHNVWADLMSRWGIPQPTEAKYVRALGKWTKKKNNPSMSTSRRHRCYGLWTTPTSYDRTSTLYVWTNINQTPVATLDHTNPMESFTGLEPTTALNTIVGKVNVRLSKTGFHTIDWKQKKLRQAVEELRKSLQEVHSTIVDKRRAAENKRMLEKTNQNEMKVTEGDFVLWSRVDENTHYPKLLVTWIGPFRVLKCLPYSCVIEHLITGVQREAHHSRHKFYVESHFQVTEEIIDHVSEQGTTLVVDQIEDARRNPGSNQWELLIRWKGLESLEASWEQLPAMHQEIPSLVQSFADQLPNGAKREGLVEALERL